MIIAIDTETQGLDTRKFVIGCAIQDNLKETYFETYKEMENWLINMIDTNKKYKKKTYIYAHNMEFDLYACMKDRLLDEKMNVLRWSPTLAIYNENGYFLDSYAFYRMNLARVGEIVELPKLETPEELINGTATDKMLLRPYVYRDTLIVLKAILKIKETLKDIGMPQRRFITAGQVAMTAFMTFIKKNGIDWTLMQQGKIFQSKHDKQIRTALRGGRVQAFKTGQFTDVYAYDQNAQHPYVETIMPFPNLATERYVEHPSTLHASIGVTRATIVSPHENLTSLPYLPIAWGNKQIYPSDCEMTATWTNLELNKALTLGYKIKKLHWTIEYQPMNINPLKEYQERLWKLRQDNKEFKNVIKLLMNSFGMKFSQRNKNTKYKLVPRNEAYTLLDKNYRFYSVMDNLYVMARDSGYLYPRYYNPIISTLIFAWSRHTLYEAMEQVPKESLLYCDTDSMMTIGCQNQHIDIGENLGQWKIQQASENSTILGEKVYYVGDKVAVSGLPSKDRSKNLIDTQKTAHTMRMHSFVQSIKEGNLSKMGSFDKRTIELKQGGKMDTGYPSKIIENE